MEDTQQPQSQAETVEDVDLLRRRDFLKSLRKWSPAVIGGVVLGALLPSCKVGGGGWANRGATWLNGGGGWINRGGPWVNRRGR